MKVGRLALAVVALVAVVMALPSVALATTFTVNVTGDQSDDDLGDGVCDSTLPGQQCTLRAAVQQANAGAGSRDTINFTPAMAGNTIFPSSEFDVDTPMVIDGGDCGDQTLAHQPCIRVDNPSLGAVAFIVDGDDVTIKGLAVTGVASFEAIRVNDGANRFKLRNSWLGMDLDQNSDPNAVGVRLAGNDAQIGGTTGADRNVFAYSNGVHLDIDDGDRNKARGNYFGTEADGTTTGGAESTAVEVNGTDNVIGATVSSSAAVTTTCDGGCNVIANTTGSQAVSLNGEDTTLKGNFIGLDKTGTAAAENAAAGILIGDAPGTTIGGSESADRNFITGGTFGIAQIGSSTPGLTVKRNFIGLNAAGTMAIDPPEFFGAATISDASDPVTVSRNRFVGSNQGLDVGGEGARVVRNKFGIGKDGGNLTGHLIGIRVVGNNSTIGEPGAGNTIGNSSTGIDIVSLGSDSGDGNKVQGNYIGTDADGAVRPLTGDGILIQDGTGDQPEGNTIGGTSSATENVISNVDGDAIHLLTTTNNPTGNAIKRNRGKDNGNGLPATCSGPCDLFVDLEGDNGFGNSTGPNGGHEAPVITNADPGDVTRTHIEGTGAQPNATIYIFRTLSAAGASPSRINAFVDTATADGSGNWSANFSQIPSGQQLTALQLDATDGSSELALAVAP